MSLLKVFNIISDQFETAAKGVRALHPPLAAPAAAADWWEQSSRLYQAGFSLLAGGEGLPFFRLNYLDVSARVFLFAAGLKSLSERFPELSALPLAAVGDCLRGTDGAFASLRLVWSRFQQDSRGAGREAGAFLPLILALRGNVSRLHSPADPTAEIERGYLCWEALTDRLLEIDLALKKLIVVAKV